MKNLQKELGNIAIINGDSFVQNYKNIERQRHVTTAALLKFFLPIIFKNEDKILYIDSDTIIQDDLTKLFNIDINEVYAGVIKDTFTISNKKYLKENNINSKYYFNSGVLLLNLSKLRIDNMPQKLIKDKQQYQTVFMDQDTFNKVLGNNVLYLSYKYNFLNYYLEKFNLKELTSLFNETLPTDENKLYKSCSILHFGGVNKPWLYDMDILSKIYKKYYEKSILKHRKLKLKKCPYTKTFAEKIFSIKSSQSKPSCKVITILGIKIKIRRK